MCVCRCKCEEDKQSSIIDTVAKIARLASTDKCECSNSYKKCRYCAAKEFIETLTEEIQYFTKTFM